MGLVVTVMRTIVTLLPSMLSRVDIVACFHECRKDTPVPAAGVNVWGMCGFVLLKVGVLGKSFGAVTGTSADVGLRLRHV
ncbi:hypothetical protein EDB19DRAFT_1781333 [Suillus lakei]|nr:hypothetical protein EDB19DRAFT_1781333 [Suillus lakei]